MRGSGLAATTLTGLLIATACAFTPVTGTAVEPPRTYIITLGTGGGPSLRLQRAQTSNAVVIGEDIYLVDCADGVLRQLAAANLPIERIRAVFITHHHLDHDGGLGPLLVQRWLMGHYRPLEVIGPPMTRQMVTHLAQAYHAIELAPITIGGPPTPAIAATVRTRDMAPDLDSPRVVYADAKVRVSAVLNEHYHFTPGSETQKASRSYAIRFDTPGRSITFTGDTGPSPRVETLARDTDVLVSEVIDLGRIEQVLRSGDRTDFPIEALIEHLRQDHLTPPQVGQLASRARAGEVVLSHIVPGYDDETDLSGYTRGLDEHYKGPVHVAQDLDRF